MLAERFPRWVERARYWHVHDIDVCDPSEGVQEIERLVDALVGGLRDGGAGANGER